MDEWLFLSGDDVDVHRRVVLLLLLIGRIDDKDGLVVLKNG